MKVYQINYDLRKQRNYDALYEKIRAYGTWCRPLASCWLVATDKTAVQVRDDLTQVLDSDDGIIVTRLHGEAAWRGLDAKVSEWLSDKLNRVTN